MKSGRMLSTQLNRERTAQRVMVIGARMISPCKKYLKQFTGNDPEFHNQWFVTKNNQTFGGVHV